MIRKLYDVVFDNRKDRKELYIKCDSDKIDIQRKSILCSEANTEFDLCTYFNSLSIKKWKQYTTIKNLYIKADILGIFDVTIYGINNDNEIVLKKIESTSILDVMIPLDGIDFYILALKITAKQDNSKIENITYYGDFEIWESKKIGVVICTFQREEYVQRTINKLVHFSHEGNNWLSILVVDNGRSLEEINRDNLKIIHNPNFGGSGGFTRGIIENLENNINDYVLLMDDDIDIDTTALERTYALLSSLKDEYKESFLAGAMLNIDRPCMQYENTAYWNKIRPQAQGKGFDLSNNFNILRNDKIIRKLNSYSGWWYCCIPMQRIKKIGLPFPMFIKGDDIEYSIRNHREIIFINGIAVWHEPFLKKMALWTNYFSDRNMLIINHYVDNCGRFTILLAIFGRLCKRILTLNKNSLLMLDKAIDSYILGVESFIKYHPEKMLEILKSSRENFSYIHLLGRIIFKWIYIMICYEDIDIKYKDFKEKKLQDTSFWKNYLKMRRF